MFRRVNRRIVGMAPIIFSISFSYPDSGEKRRLRFARWLAKFSEESVNTGSGGRRTYTWGFGGDMAAVAHTKPAPPPPVGEVVGIVSTANLPLEPANRVSFLTRGLGVGLFLGLLVALAMRRPRGRVATRRIRFGRICGRVRHVVPGFRTGSRPMPPWRSVPAMLTEDPLASLKSARYPGCRISSANGAGDIERSKPLEDHSEPQAQSV